MTKKDLSESDICDRYITPAIHNAGWLPQLISREYFTDGEVQLDDGRIVRGGRKRADYLLFFRENYPIAVVEAKRNKYTVRHGLQQALGYAETLNVPFAFSSNGDAFYLHDRSGTYPVLETELALDKFPTPDDLWNRYLQWQKLAAKDEALLKTAYHSNDEKQPRYYQRDAINQTIAAMSRGQKRCLIVMATGAGKTYTVFNILWRLWKARQARRILFLADRNALINQTITNDFSPFGEVMTKLTRKLVDSNGKINTSYQVYLGTYQAIVGQEAQEPLYPKFPSDFFDLIVVDECHRGSAEEDSNWRTVLDYFSSATQLGLTATPKETKYTSNIDYFGTPLHIYSLKRGIQDGFLAPFWKIRITLDKDIEGWTPKSHELTQSGGRLKSQQYNPRDRNQDIQFEQRVLAVAKYVSEFLHRGDPMRKTIVFCEDVAHAEKMRSAFARLKINRSLIEKNHRYVMQITGDEQEGKAEIGNFIDPEESYPVIATTSKLLSTGVDAKTCHLIVIDRPINSMTEFKQIIGRGTRLCPEYGKHFFTVIDFRNATELFEDKDWDGPAIQYSSFERKMTKKS
ncbi:EcoAI/FtnUII family type I restriction enzme subunit R [Romeriopsis navalis]|uniref:EcoAI/FtnUII family type I restriction enzme subunit R n=1 Tax=Romeriopsis navalis TaxID=2992132 RepID=UPI0021F8789C|nr:DEAD/DEAH box helicase family protein [Romeriopsis navalis]